MTPPPKPPHAIGLYLACVQFFFALGWIVYVIYLPRLAQQAGIEARWVPWLLLADQLVFIATDLAVGLASDRAARVLGRIGYWVLGASLVSAAAFMALPWLAPKGSPLLFTAITAVWVLTTSALRAPPLTLLGRYVAKPAQPMMVALASFGLGIASAVAPYLALRLKGVAPQLPFAFAALSLAAVALGMVAAERALAQHAAEGGTAAAAEPGIRPRPGQVAAFLAACVVGALAFQWHHSISSSALALRLARAEDLPWLLPVFWVGFNLCLVPAGLLTRKLGAAPTMAIGAELAMLGTAGAAFAPTLELLLAAQAATGAGWALLLCAAFSGALVLGHTGREGLMSGALSATLALAALARIAIVTSAPLAPGQALEIAWWPALAFALCAALLVGNALARNEVGR
jgi:Na+/melibiose symporter-like transporter